MTDQETDDLLAAALRDSAVAWPVALPDTVIERIVASAAFHGIASLLHARLAGRADVPGRLVEGLRAHALGTAMRELGERQALARLVPALTRCGARPLLFKGAALAYALYPDPAFRERCDTDILIGADRKAAAQIALADLGWQRAPTMPAELASRQACYQIAGPGETTYHLDLHWRVSNSALLASLFEHDELWCRSVPLPALHPDARGPSPVDALLIACMHRLVHLRMPYYFDGVPRFSADRLIWLYDIRLLAEAFSPEDWATFTRRAVEKGLAGACRDGLQSAEVRVAAPCPAAVLEKLARVEAAETPAAYLRAGWLEREWMDFRAIRGLSGKLRFLAEVAFPPVHYMESRYPGIGRGWLPWLYARRAMGGVAKRLRGRPATAERP